MAGIADIRVLAGVLGRIVPSRWRDIMTPLADTNPLLVDVFPLASGVTEEYLAGLTTLGNVTPDQVDVGPLAVIRIVRVVLHMGTVTVNALNILPLDVMVFLAGVAVGAYVQFV